MSSLLVEIGIEELPARFIEPAVKQFGELLKSRLEQERIDFGSVQLYSTPRRLTVMIDQLDQKQADLSQDVKGPPKNIAYKDGEPTKAALGFAKSQGVKMEQITTKDLDGTEYLFAHKFIHGKPTKTVLSEILPEIITAISFPKNMRWGNYKLRYARPLRWIVALLGEEVIPFRVENVIASNVTYGHRQLCSDPVKVKSAANYLVSLRESYVIADQPMRKQLIWNQIMDLVETIDGKVIEDEQLLAEVTNLVEYPTAFLGTFEHEFLEIPEAVLVTTMKEHQRYFPVYNREGVLLPYFIGVRNGADNQLDVVTAGNEKVLKARLADAKFFFDEDRQHQLEDNLSKLEAVVFQEGLGSMYDKVQRISSLAKTLTDNLNLSESAEQILRTARLGKADLVSLMVNEFPELQGIMGAKYAELAGEHPEVVIGIEDHYKPRFSGDELPRNMPGTIVSIADKVDSLVGYFGLGKIPTGSQDPFALRRQALGIVQIMLNNKITLDLSKLIEFALAGYQAQLNLSNEEIIAALLEFFSDRLRVILRNQGYRYDIIDAVLATGIDNLPAIQARVEELERIRQSDVFTNLYTAFERCSHLALKASGKHELERNKLTDADLRFEQALDSATEKVNSYLGANDYAEVLSTLASLRQPVDQFFDAVMIMDSDPQVKNNRLALLKRVVELYEEYADFGLIVMDM